MNWYIGILIFDISNESVDIVSIKINYISV